MRCWVVDASVVVKWLIGEDDSDIAGEMAAKEEDLHAPRLMASEIANALWCKARLGEIEPGDAGGMLASVPEMPVRWAADEMVCADAIRRALAGRSSIASISRSHTESARSWSLRTFDS